ncbi:MAG: ABC transporter substrate-binding protein [Nitrospirota bacterium]
MKQKRNLLAVFSICIIALSVSFLLSGCEKKTGTEEKLTFKIGETLPLTGKLGFMGESMKEALLMAKEEVEKQGGLKFNYEVIFEDDQLDPKLTANTVNKLINIDKVDAVISLDSGGGNITSELASAANIIHFGIAVSPTVADGKTNFLHWTTPREHSRVMIDALNKRGLKKVGILRSNYEDFEVQGNDFRDAVKGTGIEVVSEQVFELGEKDFRSFIAKMKENEKNNKPDIYLVLEMSPGLEIMTKAMMDAKIKTDMTSMMSFETTEEVNLFEGKWYVSPADATQEFTTNYNNKYKKNWVICAPNAYDVYKMIVFAVEHAAKSPSEKPTTQQIAAELFKIKDFNASLGTLWMDDKGMVQSKAQVKIVKDGKFVPIEG